MVAYLLIAKLTERTTELPSSPLVVSGRRANNRNTYRFYDGVVLRSATPKLRRVSYRCLSAAVGVLRRIQ